MSNFKNTNLAYPSNTIEDKCKLLSGIRNQSYELKSFEDFRIYRNNLNGKLLDVESEFRGLAIVFKTVDTINKELCETNEYLEKKIKKMEIKIRRLEEEALDNKIDQNELIKKINLCNSSNISKDNYIEELKERLETVQKNALDYQKTLERLEEGSRLLENKMELIKNENCILKGNHVIQTYNYDYGKKSTLSLSNSKSQLNFNYATTALNQSDLKNEETAINSNFLYNSSNINIIDTECEKDKGILSTGNLRSNSNSNTSNFYEKASKVYYLILKVFSSDEMTKYLKSKFGDDFHSKLTTRDVDGEFIKQIEYEISQFEKKNNSQNSQIKNNINKNTTIKSKVELDNSPKRKVFNNFTKVYSGYFDPTLQRGGRSSVTQKLGHLINCNGRTKSKNKDQIKHRLDKSVDRSMYNYREFPYGWTSMKEYFVSNDNGENKINRNSKSCGKLQYQSQTIS